MFAFSDFVGVPWKERGRGPEAFDCWGLAGAVYLAGLGIELPSLADQYASAKDKEALDRLIDGQREPWTAVTRGRAFDLVLMRERPWHVGIVTRPGFMLHMPAGGTSVIEPYTTGRHACRVEGIYRHESQLAIA